MILDKKGVTADGKRMAVNIGEASFHEGCISYTDDRPLKDKIGEGRYQRAQEADAAAQFNVGKSFTRIQRAKLLDAADNYSHNKYMVGSVSEREQLYIDEIISALNET